MSGAPLHLRIGVERAALRESVTPVLPGVAHGVALGVPRVRVARAPLGDERRLGVEMIQLVAEHALGRCGRHMRGQVGVGTPTWRSLGLQSSRR